MAAPVPTDKVKDKEYSNWLKVTLALYYMKSGLHTFVQSEVDCLHKFLVQKIYGGITVPLPPCTTCHAHFVRRNKYNGIWTFQKQCKSYCDVWLDKLLAVHKSPKSEKIYWDNSNVASWPFKSWECAKVFMPRGQPPSNVGPAECDAQAMLVLLTNCTHFHHKLSPQGLGLTHAISTIRNKVMHDGEMKLSDADRRTYLQQIIQLLEDPKGLNSLENCKAAVVNIQKIDNDSLDVFFNLDTEMTGLRSAVNELRLELGVQTTITLDTVDSLREEYKKLREQVTERLTDVENRMGAIERDVQSVMVRTDTALEQQEKKHQEMQATVTYMSAEVTSHSAKLDTVRENVEYIYQRMDSNERNVQSVKEQTDKALQQQEMKRQEMQANVANLSGNVTSQGVRLVAVEENMQSFGIELQELKTNILTRKGNNSCRKRKTAGEGMSEYGTSEAPVKKRQVNDGLRQPKKTCVKRKQESEDGPGQLKKTCVKKKRESDGLRQLKSQTENKLDTVKRLELIPATQAEEAKKLLEERRSVVIKGNPGEGKTMTALHLIDNEIYRNRRVVVYCPEDWKTVDTDWVDIVVLEDLLGQFDLDLARLQEWLVYLPTIQEHVDAGKLRIIITTRVDILSKAYSKLGSIKLFSDNLSLTLSSEKLKNSEKMNILNRELQRNKRNMKEDEKEKCISNFKGLIGFPQCCLLFAGDSILFDKGPEFFASPAKLFVENLTNLENTRFLSLAFLFCNGEIEEDYLSLETLPESSKHLLIEVAFRLHISEAKASITLLREIYDSFLGLYIVKSVSGEFSLGSCIRFSHPIVCEAVGQVLGDRCVEIVVKCGDSEYLYQRTYTAEAKDKTSQNVFIPVSVYGLLAERMVHDVAKKRLVKTVVKHSAFKQHSFVMKLKDQLHKTSRVRDFLVGIFDSGLYQDLSKGVCATFLQYMLLNDKDVVLLVYSQFLEFLACMHSNKISGCWQCQEKQKLLELALYYHHFEIADKLIAINACYTYTSLCNTARHGDLRRVHAITMTLKRSQVFSPVYNMAKEALCRAYLSGNQDVIELFLKEGITLDSKHVVDVVRHGDMNALLKVIEHLKCHNNWTPYMEKHWIKRNALCPPVYSGKIIFSFALYMAYCNEKFDMADLLVQNGVIMSMDMLLGLLIYSSQHAVSRLIQTMKNTGTWDSNWRLASVALQIAYSTQKYDACDLLIKLGFSLTMKNLFGVINRSDASFESVKKAIQHLKDTGSWDPKCYYAWKALRKAYNAQKYNVCDILVQEGILITMQHLPWVILRPLDHVKITVNQLKETDNWDPRCDYASEALKYAYSKHRYDVCDMLVQEGVSLTMKNLAFFFTQTNNGSFETAKKVIKHLKDTGNWDPECDDASKALEKAYTHNQYDVCDLLLLDGVSLTMKNLPDIISNYESSFQSVKKAIQHLKDNANWDPRCDDASKALKKAYYKRAYAVCGLLAEDGVQLIMIYFPGIIRTSKTFESVKKTIQHLKDTNKWDPKCKHAAEVLEEAYHLQIYNVCHLLIQEGVSLTMMNLCGIISRFKPSLESVKKAIQHLKDNDSWDPKCDDASKALRKAYNAENYDLCDLLVKEGVRLTMKNLLEVVVYYCPLFKFAFEPVKKAIQNLKNTGNWDPMCDDASDALKNACRQKKYDVRDLLLQEGVKLSMKILHAICKSEKLESVKKEIQYLKDTGNWDPKCDDASKILEKAYREHKEDLCDLLVQERVSLTMKNLPGFSLYSPSFFTVKKVIQHLKDTGNWDPKCDDASKALGDACWPKNYDVFDLLVQEGVALTMKNLPCVVYEFSTSFESVKKAIKYLKDTNNWDPMCDDAIKSLTDAYIKQQYDVCELLVQEGVPITMKTLLSVISFAAQTVKIKYSVRKMIKHLKNTTKWDPMCDDASKALEDACMQHRYDVFNLLVKE